MNNLNIGNLKDDSLFKLMRKELYTAVVNDAMDAMKLNHQFLPPSIRPLKGEMVIVGRAMTVLEADCTGSWISWEKNEKPFGVMFEALDSLKKNDVYICTGASLKYACFGELMATRALAVGAAGAVINGFSRDTKSLLQMKFPIFSVGSYAQDQGIRGRVIDFNCPIEFENNVLVEPGDIIFGDIDGVLVIPKRYEKEIIKNALEKVYGENEVREALRNGMSVVDAFKKFKIM
jgi:regulator of RNase E activity RraA